MQTTNGAHDTTNTTNGVGIISGHFQTKVACGSQTAVFPSVAARAPQVRAGDGMGTGPVGIQLSDGEIYLVGHDALQFAPKQVIAILDRARYQHPAFVAMARAALQAVLPAPDPIRRAPVLIMTGMPAAWFHDATSKTHLIQALQAAARPWGAATVLIVPEAAGIFYLWVRDRGPDQIQGMTGVLDIGYRDANVALYRDTRYIDGRSIPGGMVQALEQIKVLLDRAYQLELDLHAVDAAVRAGIVEVGGRACPLPTGTDAALASVLDPILAVGRSLWPNGGRTLRHLVLGGGGVISQVARIQAVFPQVVVPGADLTGDLLPAVVQARVQAAEPHLAGARGLAWIAQQHHAQQHPA